MARGKGYRFAIAWIAEIDESASLDVEHMEGMATVVLVAEMFDKEPKEVAEAVIRLRKKELEK